MADARKRYPGWTPWAVAGAVIVLFIAIAFIGGLGGRPKSDASGTTRALHLPGSVIGALTSPVTG